VTTEALPRGHGVHGEATGRSSHQARPPAGAVATLRTRKMAPAGLDQRLRDLVAWCDWNSEEEIGPVRSVTAGPGPWRKRENDAAPILV
jgi:hypothetical protein